MSTQQCQCRRGGGGPGGCGEGAHSQRKRLESFKVRLHPVVIYIGDNVDLFFNILYVITVSRNCIIYVKYHRPLVCFFAFVFVSSMSLIYCIYGRLFYTRRYIPTMKIKQYRPMGHFSMKICMLHLCTLVSIMDIFIL